MAGKITKKSCGNFVVPLLVNEALGKAGTSQGKLTVPLS